MRNLLSFTDDWANTAEPDASGDVASVPDQRLKELKRYILRDEERENSLKMLRMVVWVSKRVHLVELTDRYMEESEAKKATPKRKRDRKLSRQSPMDRFTDLLFPETIKFKSKRTN